MRMFAYRVYFSVAPTAYHVVSASNVRKAIWRAKRSQRALRLHKRRKAPLVVAKVERLYRGAQVRELNVG